MKNKSDVERKAVIAGVAAVVAAGFSYWLSGNTGPQIEVVETQAACDRAVRKLRQKCEIISFDCQWVYPKKVALIQLYTPDYCALFRICKMGGVPLSLDNLLGNANVRKIGVGIFEDAVKLSNDFKVNVRGALDLRFLAGMTGHEPQNLPAMAESVLNVTMDENEIRSDWEAAILNESQEKHAFDHVEKAFKIYEKLTEGISDLSLLWNFLDVRYHQQNHRNLPRIDNLQRECVIQ